MAKTVKRTAEESSAPPVHQAAVNKRQQELIDRVGRTYALSMRVLPDPLFPVMRNLYLWWRLADTIEDDARLSAGEKSEFLDQLPFLWDKNDAVIERYRRSLLNRLADDTKPGERELIENLLPVAAVTRSFPEVLRLGMGGSVRAMATGMAHYQMHYGRSEGLPDIDHLRDYCYQVAGRPAYLVFRDIVSFFYPALFDQSLYRSLTYTYGQTVQTANILKDIWTDRERGVCWLPRDIFRVAGMELADRQPGGGAPWRDGLNEIIRQTRQHYESAIHTLTGVRRRYWHIRLLGLWTMGMAICTIRQVHRQPFFRDAREIRISRYDVYRLGLLALLGSVSNRCMLLCFLTLSRDLPASTPSDERPTAKKPTPTPAPTRSALIRDPGHGLSLGLGAGWSPVMPGTVGSLWAFPLHGLLHTQPSWVYAGVVALGAVAGVWLCGRTARVLGQGDPRSIVWDEIIGCLIVFAWLGSTDWITLATGFALFRLFDIVKPWPICWFDRHVKGGTGIMLDDILAAAAAVGCLYIGELIAAIA